MTKDEIRDRIVRGLGELHEADATLSDIAEACLAIGTGMLLELDGPAPLARRFWLASSDLAKQAGLSGAEELGDSTQSH